MGNVPVSVSEDELKSWVFEKLTDEIPSIVSFTFPKKVNHIDNDSTAKAFLRFNDQILLDSAITKLYVVCIHRLLPIVNLPYDWHIYV